MGERQVTVDTTTHKLATPFMVIATQNPIEHEGTYPLPEAQLDRFLMKISIGYPGRSAELDILDSHGSGDPLSEITPVVTAAELRAMTTAHNRYTWRHCCGLHRRHRETTRRHPALTLGMSTRAALALQRVSRVQAASVMRTT